MHIGGVGLGGSMLCVGSTTVGVGVGEESGSSWDSLLGSRTGDSSIATLATLPMTFPLCVLKALDLLVSGVSELLELLFELLLPDA